MLAKKTKSEEKPIRDLSLGEIQAELASIPRRVDSLKAARDQWSAMPLSREELRAKVKDWFAGVTAQGADDLLARLKSSGFMRENDSNPDPAILLNGSSSTWQSRAVDAQGIATIFSPLIGAFLNSWVDSLPDEEVGAVTAAERDAELARIDLERQGLIARRTALKQILSDTAASADAPLDVQELTRGGMPGNLDLNKIEQKVFER